MVADIPAISTYQAMWYNLSKARSKAILHGNNLKNRTRRVIHDLGIQDESIIIVNRDTEIKDNHKYLQKFASISTLYSTNKAFRDSVNNTSKDVLDNSGRTYSPADIEQATHYLLSEIAFLEYAPEFFGAQKICYVYHKNRRVYEDYIAWIFDSIPKLYLDFVLLEAPYETYLTIASTQKTRREQIQERWEIRCSFVPYYNYFNVHSDGTYSWLFFEILQSIATTTNVRLKFTEQSWYGTLTQRLTSGDIDIFCSPTRPTRKRRLEMFFSDSLFESNIFAYINKSSPYANQSIEQLKKNPNLRIAVKENDIHHELAIHYFPEARLIRVPQLSHIEEVLKFVLNNRADMTFREDKLVETYLSEHGISSNQLRKKSNNNEDEPMTTYSNCYALPRWEFDLKNLIDDGIDKYKDSSTSHL